jgi:hypothetical protein
MSIGGVFQALTDDRPQLGSTALVVGRLIKQPSGEEVPNPTGTFTLRRGATIVVDTAAMIPAPEEDFGPHQLLYTIDAAVMLRGQYTWDMLLTEPATGYKSLKTGRFTLG